MMHFFDIGSNIGSTFDNYLLKTNDYDGWHIWCFEPSPRNITALRDRCADIILDTKHDYKITICPFALAAKTQWRKLYEKSTSEGDSLFETTFVGDVEVINQPIIALDIICTTVNVVDFMLLAIPEGEKVVLKIDCEGAEYEIMVAIMASPPALSRIERVLIEYHGLEHHETDLRLRLSKEFLRLNISVSEWTL